MSNPQFAMFSAFAQVAAQAAQFAGMQVIAGGGGIVVTMVDDIQGGAFSVAVVTDGHLFPAFASGVTPRRLGIEATPLATVEAGHGVTGLADAWQVSRPASGGGPIFLRPSIYVPDGSAFVVLARTANVAIAPTIVWSERR